jgi:hypothetical protein
MRPKVIFFAGWGRSGSTLLTNLLAEIDGYFSVGEVVGFEKPGAVCGCGEPVLECPFWRPVLARVEQAYGTLDWAAIHATRMREAVPRKIPALLVRPRLAPGARRLARLYDLVYTEAARETGARVIIDSTKDPSMGALLARTRPEVVYVHLVRDPRAVSYSWAKRPHGDLESFSLAGSTARWLEWNALSELVTLGRRPLRFRYEQVVDETRAVLETIVGRVGEGAVPDNLIGDRAVQLEATHTIGGNPARLNTMRGNVKLTRDEAWRSGLTTREKALVTAISLPLLRHYGYRSFDWSAPPAGDGANARRD